MGRMRRGRRGVRGKPSGADDRVCGGWVTVRAAQHDERQAMSDPGQEYCVLDTGHSASYCWGCDGMGELHKKFWLKRGRMGDRRALQF
jgi:hypothetical protein